MNQLDYLAYPPVIHPISKIITPKVWSYRSKKMIPVYEIRKKDCGVILLDIVFYAGRPLEHKKMVAAACASLLGEGAGTMSAEMISEEIDFMGASLSTRASLDFITIKAVFLRKYLDQIIRILSEIVSSPTFSQSELAHYKEKSIDRLKYQMAKTDIRSYRMITEAMYGQDHPYGYNSSEQLYNELTVSDLKRHYEEHITAEHCQVFIAGDINDGDRIFIDELCASIRDGHKKEHIKAIMPAETLPQHVFYRAGTNQTSVRIGRRACTRKHEDYEPLNYVCTILGGYFGSRLIARLREDLGLTYNIYSSLDTQLYDGDLMISTEVANQNVRQCLAAIYREMEILQNDLLSDEELSQVNNYLMGNYLNLFDGPFNSIRAIKSLALAQIPLDDLDSLIKSSLSFDTYQVRDMSRKYFNRNDFWEVIVGTPEE